jgi:DNA-binding MarR family transcriptional regulator
VLRAIQRHEGEPLTRMAEDLCMDRTSLYRAIEPMRRDGWVTVSSGADARTRSARFTAKGLKVLKEADSYWGQLQTAAIDRFGREKWAALVSELERLSACTRAAASPELE